MTTLNNRLQLALLNRKKGQNALEKGFTLVELMIVIVIVGILSAVALPNFLSQTEKAKGTEATSKVSALLKESHAEYQFGRRQRTAVSGISTQLSQMQIAGGIFTYNPSDVSGATAKYTCPANILMSRQHQQSGASAILTPQFAGDGVNAWLRQCH